VTNYVTALNLQQQQHRTTEHHPSPTSAVQENKHQSEENESRLQTAMKANQGEIPLLLRCQVAHRCCRQTETESENSAEKQTGSLAVTAGAGGHDGGKIDDRLVCYRCKQIRCRAMEVKLYFYAFVI